MSIEFPPAEPTWARFASRALAPRFVLTVIWAAIVIGTVASAPWAMPLFWALVIVTVAATALALAGAKPLPALAERSHLFRRLSWLTRYGTGTIVLCLSTFLGAIAGLQAGSSDAQSIVDGVGALLALVGLWAARIAAVLFLGWLVVDVHRMSEKRRRKGVKRALRKALPMELREIALDEVIVRWLLALSSRPSATVALGAVVISSLWAL